MTPHVAFFTSSLTMSLPPSPSGAILPRRAPLPCSRSAVEQLVEVSQTRAIADALVKLRGALAGRGGPWTGRPLTQVLDALEAEMDERGVDALAGRAKPGNLARPRRFELAAAVNRLRTAQLRQLA